MKTKTLVCQRCNKEFIITPCKDGSFSKRKYCDECQRPTTKTLMCKKCGKEFVVGRGSDGNFLYRQYCDECLKPLQEKTSICGKCGKEFKLEKRKDGKGFLERKYCDTCSIRPETEIHICKYCGKSFEVKQYENSTKYVQQYYCSDYCRTKGYEQNKQKTNLKRYGKPHYVQTEKFLTKLKQTCQEKYGVDYPCLTENALKSNPVINSKINQAFGKLLRKNNITYISDYKLGNYFYDFYLEKQNTLIEINPTISHTDINTGIFPALDKNYHKNKTKFANQNGLRCINIWDWDNWDKIIEQFTQKEKIGARKLQIKEITKQEANLFLDRFHQQNSCYGNQINLALVDEKYNIYQIMTFGKPRYNKNYQWELLRLCTNSKYKIIGGTIKLFKYFIENYKPKSIISYCDLSKFNGNVYIKLGFKLLRENQPVKYWSKNHEYISSALLLQKGYDKIFKTDYGKGTDNEQLMLNDGWLSIYDCGQAVYEWYTERSDSN